jgi:hypothetical protein
VAAIAKGRAANINQCTAVGDSRYRGAKDIGAGCRGNRTQYRNAGAVSGCGYSANLVRDHGIGVSAASYRPGKNETRVTATGYRTNLIRDYETGVSATGYRANLIREHGTGVSAAVYSCRFFGRW